MSSNILDVMTDVIKVIGMNAPPGKLSPSEFEVMEALWAAGSELTITGVLELVNASRGVPLKRATTSLLLTIVPLQKPNRRLTVTRSMLAWIHWPMRAALMKSTARFTVGVPERRRQQSHREPVEAELIEGETSEVLVDLVRLP